jgi:hypothetical protein
MKTIETCLGHITGDCVNCKSDEKNKYCPNYSPFKMRVFEVVENPYSAEEQKAVYNSFSM